MRKAISLKIALWVLCALCMLISVAGSATNLSLNAAGYQSSSNYIPSQAGNFAYDGNLFTKWTSLAAPNQWLAIDLGQNSNVTSIVLKLASSCGTCDPATYNLKNYEIQTAPSFGGPWVSKGAFSNASQAAVTTYNLIFSARYVRLYVTNAGIDQHVRLPEFEIHGTYAGTPNAPASLQVIAPTCTNENALFAWSNSGTAWMMDISKTVNGNFDPNNFFNKNVSNATSTNGPGGFTSYLINGQVNTSQSLSFQPGQWYSWRIWNGTTHTYGPTFQAPICNQPPPSSTCRNIYGIHFWEPSAANIMNGKKGWTVEIVNTEDGQSGGWGINNAKNIIQQIRNQGIFEPIVRIDKNWGKNVPNNSADFAAFASDCKNVVQQLAAAPYNVKWFTIGNEPNLAGENSGNSGNNGKGVPADVYAACFKQCYNVIKAAVSQTKILVAGPGTFNAQGPLSNSSGAGVYYDVYFERVVTQVGNSSDGYAIHAYGLANTQSPDNNLQAAYKNSNAWEFDCFKVYMAILAKYPYAKSKAVHITETNTNSHGNLPSSSYYSQWMQQAYGKINSWNQASGNQPIESLCWFVYKDYGGWGNYSLLTQSGNMGQGRSDFNWLTANANYKPANCPGQVTLPDPNSSMKLGSPINTLSVYHPFPDSSAMWKMHHVSSGLCPGVAEDLYSIIISGDTLINAQKYQKLNVSGVQIISSSGNWICPNTALGYKGAVREDSANRKVFFIPKTTNTEQLLYDFNMQVGDTVKGYTAAPPSSPDKVISIDSVMTSLGFRKRWNINTCYGISLIEGIGSMYGLIEKSPGCVTDQAYYSLVCFQQNGAGVYPAFSANCSMVTGVNSQDALLPEIKLYPNPASDILNIELPEIENIGSANIQVYNYLGAEMRSSFMAVSPGNGKIDVSALPKGIYMISVSLGELRHSKLFIVN